VPGLPTPRPIPIRDRVSLRFVEKVRLDVLDGPLVLVDEGGIRTHIPFGGSVCLMVKPGTLVSHRRGACGAGGDLADLGGGRVSACISPANPVAAISTGCCCKLVWRRMTTCGCASCGRCMHCDSRRPAGASVC